MSSKTLRRKRLNILTSAIPAFLISVIIICVIYAIKKVFPFGSEDVAYMDMFQMNVPIYYHLYDALHGDKALFYDLFTGLGINMSESVSICSLLSPFNIFFYFVPRDGIMHFMAIFTLIKIAFSSYFMGVFIKYQFKKTHIIWQTAGAVAYGFCGLNLQYYTNSQWLDIVALLPLVMLSLCYCMKNKKVIPYAIMLGIYLITNPYLALMSLLFIFFTAALYILFLSPKSEKALQIFHLGIGTVSGVAISAFSLLPFMYQTGRTSRLSSTFLDIYKAILKTKYELPVHSAVPKYWMLWGTALAVAFIMYGICQTWKRNKRKNIVAIVAILFVTIQIFSENINLIWHAGSYVLFPMRFGFVTSFLIWAIAFSYINEIPKLNRFKRLSSYFKGKRTILGILGIVLGLAYVIILTYFGSKFFIDKPDSDMIIISIILFFILLQAYFIVIRKNPSSIIKIIVSLTLISEAAIGTYLFLGIPYVDLAFRSNPNMKFAEEVTEVTDAFNIDSSTSSRIKNADAYFTSNYPFIMQKSALSNWTHSVDAEIQGSYKALGYSTIYTRLVDTGGTVFLDALLNVDDVITTKLLPEKSYTYVSTYEKLKYYKTNYKFGFGTVMSNNVLTVNVADTFSAQNSVWHAMTGNNNLFHIIQYNSDIDSSIITKKETIENDVNYEINVSGVKNLYLEGGAEVKISINGSTYDIKSSGHTNSVYPVGFNNAIIDLGVYQDEVVSLTLHYTTNVNEINRKIALMDYSIFDTLLPTIQQTTDIVENKNGFELNAIGSPERNMVLLPISYDEGLKCTVNGEKAEVRKVLNTLCAVYIENGENHIEIKFVPKNMVMGMIIGIVTLALLLAYNFIFLRRNKVKFNQYVSDGIVSVFSLIFFVMVQTVYLVPILYQIGIRLTK